MLHDGRTKYCIDRSLAQRQADLQISTEIQLRKLDDVVGAKIGSRVSFQFRSPCHVAGACVEHNTFCEFVDQRQNFVCEER